jgi:hypothetical protein
MDDLKRFEAVLSLLNDKVKDLEERSGDSNVIVITLLRLLSEIHTPPDDLWGLADKFLALWYSHSDPALSRVFTDLAEIREYASRTGDIESEPKTVSYVTLLLGSAQPTVPVDGMTQAQVTQLATSIMANHYRATYMDLMVEILTQAFTSDEWTQPYPIVSQGPTFAHVSGSQAYLSFTGTFVEVPRTGWAETEGVVPQFLPSFPGIILRSEPTLRVLVDGGSSSGCIRLMVNLVVDEPTVAAGVKKKVNSCNITTFYLKANRVNEHVKHIPGGSATIGERGVQVAYSNGATVVMLDDVYTEGGLASRLLTEDTEAVDSASLGLYKWRFLGGAGGDIQDESGDYVAIVTAWIEVRVAPPNMNIKYKTRRATGTVGTLYEPFIDGIWVIPDKANIYSFEMTGVSIGYTTLSPPPGYISNGITSYATMDIKSMIAALESRVSNLEVRVSNLESAIANTGDMFSSFQGFVANMMMLSMMLGPEFSVASHALMGVVGIMTIYNSSQAIRNGRTLDGTLGVISGVCFTVASFGSLRGLDGLPRNRADFMPEEKSVLTQVLYGENIRSTSEAALEMKYPDAVVENKFELYESNPLGLRLPEVDALRGSVPYGMKHIGLKFYGRGVVTLPGGGKTVSRTTVIVEYDGFSSSASNILRGVRSGVINDIRSFVRASSGMVAGVKVLSSTEAWVNSKWEYFEGLPVRDMVMSGQGRADHVLLQSGGTVVDIGLIEGIARAQTVVRNVYSPFGADNNCQFLADELATFASSGIPKGILKATMTQTLVHLLRGGLGPFTSVRTVDLNALIVKLIDASPEFRDAWHSRSGVVQG